MKIASNFTRILSNENVSPNSKGLRALGWPVKGVGAVPQFFALVSPNIFDLCGLHGHSCAQYSTAEPKKTQVLKIAAAANPPLQRVHLTPQYLQVEAHF